jgi:leucyl-tRNA synthetase
MQKYDHIKIEKKWQAKWEKDKIYEAQDSSKKPKFYSLIEFPYPSGEGLHVGHVRSNTAMDIISRKRRMQGYNVLYPIGWDAFGLPSENYAIKTGIHPSITTKKNINNFRRQLKSIGFSFDWKREVNTTDPKYYKWTQWIFLQLFKKGLAYKNKASINWCPSCKTGLANEEVVDSKCERCGSEVEKKEKTQWTLAITKYADRLYDDLDSVDYLDKIKIQQRNWIGRSEGTEISFPIKTKYKYVILHGWKSDSKSCFIPWLKRELEEKGHEVIALDLPDPYLPNVVEQADYVLSKVKFDKNTVIIGHSLGSVVSYRILEKLKTPIKKLILVGGLIEPKFRGDKPRFAAKYLMSWKFDIKKIKKNAREIIILEDDNDNIIADGESQVIQQQLGGEAHRLKAEKAHFCGTVEPLILEHCLDEIKVFTTRADTLFGATYLVLAPEHQLVQNLKKDIKNWNTVEKYIKQAGKRSEIERTAEGKEKTGVKLEGVMAINPANGKKIPIFIADYVLADYGTGAIMAVPAHDHRDHQFAIKFKLPIIPVIINDLPTILDHVAEAYVGTGKMVNSGQFNGLDNERAKIKIAKFVRGKEVTRYKLRDWVFSRQHYWGEPIPMIHCPKCGWQPVPEKDLPIILPHVEKYKPTNTGESPLSLIKDWVKTKCPVCKGSAERETDTMPNWAGSSWYYLRYIDPKNNKSLADLKKTKYWLPVDWYNGGMEHTTLHLLYSRFWHKFLYDIGIVTTIEPYQKRTSHGMILGEGGIKMSKSKGNVVNPDDTVKNYGADTLRLYEMFMGPFDQSISWDTASIIGSYRFLEKVWRTSKKVTAKKIENKNLEKLTHQSIKKVTDDIEVMSFNTAISNMMILVNEYEKQEILNKKEFLLFLQILAPFAPHLAEELWSNLGEKKSIHLSAWPTADTQKLTRTEVKIVIQINGKVRATLEIQAGQSEENVIKLALANPQVSKWLESGQHKKAIYIKDRLLNFVV